MAHPKLTKSTKEKARVLKKAGASVDQIAEKVGVSRRTVQRLFARHRSRATREADPAVHAPDPAARRPESLRHRVLRLERALHSARARAAPESPLGVRLTADLVDLRLLLGRIDQRPDVPTFSYDEIDAALRSVTEEINAIFAGRELHCANCEKTLVVETQAMPSPIWRPTGARKVDPRELTSDLFADLDEIEALIAGSSDTVTEAKYLRQTGRILNLVGRLERGAPPEGIPADASDDAMAELEENIKVLQSRRCCARRAVENIRRILAVTISSDTRRCDREGEPRRSRTTTRRDRFTPSKANVPRQGASAWREARRGSSGVGSGQSRTAQDYASGQDEHVSSGSATRERPVGELPAVRAVPRRR